MSATGTMPGMLPDQELQDSQTAPPLPPKGEVVTDRALYLTQIAEWRNAQAFAGQKNPTNIWSSMVRDDSSSIIFYRELEEKDEDVANSLDALKYSVLKRDRNVAPADDSSQATEIADFVQQQLDSIHDFEGVLDNLLDAPGYGFSVAEMLFDVSEGQVALLDIHDCPQELFLFNRRFYPQIGPPQFLDNPYALEGAVVPEEKFLIFSHRGRSRNRMGRPLLRSVFWPSWFKRNILAMWLRYGEKGPGTVVVRYNDGAGDDERLKAVLIAEAIVSEAAIAVPENFNYDQELLKLARALDPAVYEHLYDKMQLSIVRRIQGETLTSMGGEGGKGTQALGKVHEETKEDRSVSIAKMLMDVVNKKLVRPLVMWNYGPQAPMPVWSIDIAEEEDLARSVVIHSSLQKMGLPFTENFLRTFYNVPAPDESDTTVTPIAGGATPNIPQAAVVAQDANDGPTFSEKDDAEKRMSRDYAQFDKLIAQLVGESKDLYKTRVKQIAEAVK